MTIAIITEQGVRKVAPLVVTAQQAATSANVSAQMALAIVNDRIVSSQAAGEAITTTGQEFVVYSGGVLTLYTRTGGGSTAISSLPYVDIATGYLIATRVGINVAPAVRAHVKDSTAEVLRLETTNSRGGGNLFQSWYDTTGRKGFFGYAGATDVFSLMNETNAALQFGVNGGFRWQITSAGHLAPIADNAVDIGGGSLRVRTVYATTGTINTSDAREKTAIRAFTAPELVAAKRIAGEIGIFQFLDGTREHVGVIAQAVWTIMADEGLIDPITEGARPSCRYAFLCYDEWEVDEASDIEAGNRFAIRPDQLALFLIAAQEARLAALEAA